MKKLLWIIAAGCLLAACKVHLPAIESCLVATISNGVETPDKSELAPAQVGRLARWFVALDDQWEYKVSDHYPAGIVLVLKHKDGKVTRLNLRGDKLWVRSRVKTLTPVQRNELLSIIARENLLPAFGRQ